MDNELKIKTRADLAEFKNLQTTVKDLDYQFRQNTINAVQLKNGLNDVEKAASSLNITYKNQVDLNAQIYQVTQRSSVGFKSLAVSVDQLKGSMAIMNEEVRARANMAVREFGEVIQATSMGGRNLTLELDRLVRSFGMMKDQTGSAGEALRAFTTSFMGTGGFVAGFIMLARFAPEIFGFFNGLISGLGNSTEALKKFNLEKLKSGGLFGSDAEKNASTLNDMQKASDIRLKNEIKYWSHQYVENKKNADAEELIIAKMKDKEKLTDKEKNNLEIISINYANHLFQLKSIEDTLRGITDIERKRRDNSEKNKPLRDIHTGLLDVGFKDGEMESYEKVNPMRKSQTPKQFLDDWDKVQKEALRAREEHVDSILKENGEKSKEQFRSAMNAYNSVFFDPIKAAFDAVATGSNNMADAFVKALEKMIVKLLEMSIYSEILNLLFPVSGGFSGVFMNVAGLSKLPTEVTSHDKGGWINEPIIGFGKSGAIHTFAENNPEYVVNPKKMANSMLGGIGGNQNIIVHVKGELAGDKLMIVTDQAKIKNSLRFA